MSISLTPNINSNGNDDLVNSTDNNKTIAFGYGYDGTNWDRLRLDSNYNLNIRQQISPVGVTFFTNATGTSTGPGIYTGNNSYFVVRITPTTYSGTIQFQFSPDNANWYSLGLSSLTSSIWPNQAIGLTNSTNLINNSTPTSYHGTIPPNSYIRVNITAATGGSVSISGSFTAQHQFLPISTTGNNLRVQLGIGSSELTSFNADVTTPTSILATGMYMYNQNNTSGDRIRSAVFGDAGASSLVLATGLYVSSGSTAFNRARDMVGVATDTSIGTGVQAVGLMGFDGTSYGRIRVDSNYNLKVNTASVGTTTITLLNAVATAQIGSAFSTGGMRTIDFYLSGTFTGVAFVPQYSVDGGTNWRNLGGERSNDGINTTTLTTTNTWLRCQIPPNASIRGYLSTISTGSVTAVAYASADSPLMTPNGIGVGMRLVDFNGNYPTYTTIGSGVGDGGSIGGLIGGVNASALFGYNGSSYDRLRTTNLGELKTSKFSVGSTTITLLNAVTTAQTSPGFSVGGMRTVDFYLTGTFTGLSVVFQYSVDGGTIWRSLGGERSDGTNTTGLTTTNTWIRCQIPPNASVRAYLVSISTGSATVVAYASPDSPLMTPNGIGIGMRLVDYNGNYPSYTNIGTLGDANSINIVGGANISANYGYIGAGLYDRMRSEAVFKTREYNALGSGAATDIWYSAGKKWRLMGFSASASVAGKYSLRDGASNLISQFFIPANDTVDIYLGNGLLSGAAGQTLWIKNDTAGSSDVRANAWGTEE